MLDTICDIKNNKKRTKEDPAHHTRLKKWLQKVNYSLLVFLRTLTFGPVIFLLSKVALRMHILCSMCMTSFDVWPCHLLKYLVCLCKIGDVTYKYINNYINNYIKQGKYCQKSRDLLII